MSNQLISVIMPVKNGALYIEEALQALHKQQMHCEILVVDDGSTDATAHIARQHMCTVIRHDISKGAVIAKNTGLQQAKGDFVLFHDADDVMNPHALATMYQTLSQNCALSAVMAQVQDFYSPELLETEKAKISIKEKPYYGLFTGAILMRKTIFDIIGLFEESVKAGEILDWQTKMDTNNLLIKKLPFVATNRRIHSTNYGRTNKDNEFKDYASLLRKKIQSNN